MPELDAVLFFVKATKDLIQPPSPGFQVTLIYRYILMYYVTRARRNFDTPPLTFGWFVP